MVNDYQPVSFEHQANMTTSEGKVAMTILPSIHADEADIFHDTTEPPEDEIHTYYDEDTKQMECLKYYDPNDKIPLKGQCQNPWTVPSLLGKMILTLSLTISMMMTYLVKIFLLTPFHT